LVLVLLTHVLLVFFTFFKGIIMAILTKPLIDVVNVKQNHIYALIEGREGNEEKGVTALPGITGGSIKDVLTVMAQVQQAVAEINSTVTTAQKLLGTLEQAARLN
jgi:hypothetical protein